MRVLITGGAGFIGSNLARAALERNLEVTVIDDLSTGYQHNLLDLDIRFVQASILDRNALESALDGVDSIVHLAALPSVPRSIEDPTTSHAVNATGTLHVLEAARALGPHHIIVASSSSVYGLNSSMPKSERGWTRPLSPYGVSKLASEQYALAYQQSYGQRTLAFRFFNVYGPRQSPGHAYAAVVPAFMDAILEGRHVPLHGDGEQSRDFTFVGSVCQVLIDAAVQGITHPEPVNLAFGSNITLKELISTIERVSGRKATIEPLPARRGDVRQSQADSSVLQALFPGVNPVPLQEGIRQTLTWFAARQPG